MTILHWPADGDPGLAGWTLETSPLPEDAGAPAGLRLTLRDGDGALLATAALQPRAGLNTPRHWFHVGQTVHAAPDLGLFKVQRTLLLGSDLCGGAELHALDVGGLAALEAPVRRRALVWLTDTAALQVSQEPEVWGPGLFCELPGLRSAEGGPEGDPDGPATLEHSPFWRGLPAHFFRGDPADAAARLGPGWRTHLAALLPRQLIHASFLSDAAQAAVGVERPDARWVREALEGSGWTWRQQVRIDDGGPVLQR